MNKDTLQNISVLEIDDLAVSLSANLEEPHNPLVNVEMIQGGEKQIFLSTGLSVPPKTLRKIAGKFMQAANVAEKKIQEYWEEK